MVELAHSCGRLFGLELFGLDCIETHDGLRVIEVNEFPNYTLVPGANQKLAGYVVRRARHERGAA
jgi:ribosomal protein S6--L-glutamate ligase